MSPSRVLVCLVTLLASSGVVAGGYADALSGASIEWEDVEFDVEVGGAPATFEMTRVGASLMERVHPRLALGLRGGYLEITSPDDPQLAGADPHGGFLGVSAAGELWSAGAFRLLVQADYLYAYARLEGTQVNSLRLTEGGARLAAAWRVGPVELAAGAYTMHLRGTETSSAPALTQDVRLAGGSGSFAGLDLIVEETGRVGLRFESGAREGLALVFARDW